MMSCAQSNTGHRRQRSRNAPHWHHAKHDSALSVSNPLGTSNGVDQGLSQTSVERENVRLKAGPTEEVRTTMVEFVDSILVRPQEHNTGIVITPPAPQDLPGLAKPLRHHCCCVPSPDCSSWNDDDSSTSKRRGTRGTCSLRSPFEVCPAAQFEADIAATSHRSIGITRRSCRHSPHARA